MPGGGESPARVCRQRRREQVGGQVIHKYCERRENDEKEDVAVEPSDPSRLYPLVSIPLVFATHCCVLFSDSSMTMTKRSIRNVMVFH